jgi:hypothetical protein
VYYQGIGAGDGYDIIETLLDVVDRIVSKLGLENSGY